MRDDYRWFLWFLKAGALVNGALLFGLFTLANSEPHVVVPAVILLTVSGFRCLFPNRYVDNVVFHDHPLSGIALTRTFATFSEVAYIYQFSYVIRVLNKDGVGWIDALAWWMVVQVVISQACVWGAIATKRRSLFAYEELGWLILFGANTVASAFLMATVEVSGGGQTLLILNLVFGVFYLPWQVMHLRSLFAAARADVGGGVPWRQGLRDALHQRRARTDAPSWGGGIGATWMLAYWATLVPAWVFVVAREVSAL